MKNFLRNAKILGRFFHFPGMFPLEKHSFREYSISNESNES